MLLPGSNDFPLGLAIIIIVIAQIIAAHIHRVVVPHGEQLKEGVLVHIQQRFQRILFGGAVTVRSLLAFGMLGGFLSLELLVLGQEVLHVQLGGTSGGGTSSAGLTGLGHILLAVRQEVPQGGSASFFGGRFVVLPNFIAKLVSCSLRIPNLLSTAKSTWVNSTIAHTCRTEERQNYFKKLLAPLPTFAVYSPEIK